MQRWLQKPPEMSIQVRYVRGPKLPCWTSLTKSVWSQNDAAAMIRLAEFYKLYLRFSIARPVQLSDMCKLKNFMTNTE
jgi:hypothetical protein